VKKYWYKHLILLFMGILVAVGTAHPVEPTPEVKEILKKRGALQAYFQERASYADRGINTPSRYAPDVSRWQSRGLGKQAQKRDLNALVILVDFNDQVADSSNTQASFDSLLFSEGEHPTGSMNDWYLENSYGQIGISGAVTPWLRMPETYAYYVDDKKGFGSYPKNAQGLVEDALEAADPIVDYSQYDNNNDGYVDALFVVHSGIGFETSGDSTDIHSHKWAIPWPVVYDGVTIQEYTMEPELHDSTLVRMGVFGHEFGHMLGLPDLYDTDYSSNGVGLWSMMSGGSWGGGGKTPVHFDIWCKSQLRWITPQNLLRDSMGVSLPPIETTPSGLRLWTEGQIGSEYFLVENRQQTGFDVSLPGEGLLIWHIDDAVSENSNDWHKQVTLEQADGFDDLEHGNGSDNGDPYPGATNNTAFTGTTTPSSLSYSGDSSFVRVKNITALTEDIHFDAGVSYTVPYITFHDYRILDDSGNRNGALNSGEIDTIGFLIDNQGLSLDNASITISADNSDLIHLNDSVFVGTIPEDAVIKYNSQFIVRVPSDAGDWGIANVSVHIEGQGGYTFDDTTAFIINQGYGFTSDIESGHRTWDHYPVTGGYVDEWHISTWRNSTVNGNQSWKVGGPDTVYYRDKVDAALETPLLQLKDNLAYELVFQQYMDAENEDGSTAWDGGRVEISADSGQTWEPLTPYGGYPHTIIRNPDSPFEEGTPVFSGFTGWEEIRMPLDGYAGNVILRFRFGSDAYVTKEGWYIDDVDVREQVGVDIAGDNRGLPATIELMPNYPNPFNPVTTIPYVLSKPGHVTITVYDIRGKLVRTLVETRRKPGKYTVTWDGRDEFESQVGSGVYVLRMAAGGVSQTRKITLLR